MPKRKDVKPTPAEFQALKDWLKTQGFKQTDLDAAIGAAVAGRTRAQIAVEVTQHLKGSKKKQPVKTQSQKANG